jgi:hypothetical protein
MGHSMPVMNNAHFVKTWRAAVCSDRVSSAILNPASLGLLVQVCQHEMLVGYILFGDEIRFTGGFLCTQSPGMFQA